LHIVLVMLDGLGDASGTAEYPIICFPCIDVMVLTASGELIVETIVLPYVCRGNRLRCTFASFLGI
jgi:hypothetical protein